MQTLFCLKINFFYLYSSSYISRMLSFCYQYHTKVLGECVCLGQQNDPREPLWHRLLFSDQKWIQRKDLSGSSYFLLAADFYACLKEFKCRRQCNFNLPRCDCSQKLCHRSDLHLNLKAIGVERMNITGKKTSKKWKVIIVAVFCSQIVVCVTGNRWRENRQEGI